MNVKFPKILAQIRLTALAWANIMELDRQNLF